jgi:hypothetical protein
VRLFKQGQKSCGLSKECFKRMAELSMDCMHFKD